MNDLDILENYLAEAPPEAEESKGDIGDFFQAPAKNDSPVNIQAGEKVESHIEAGKKKAGSGFLNKAGQAKKKSEKTLGAIVPDVKDLPTPPTGGIGLLLFLSLLMVFAITKTDSGQTRLQLVWGAILGTQKLDSGSGPAPQAGTNTLLLPTPYIQGSVY
jgi:hypothetical protein